jgi:hypothetical protein
MANLATEKARTSSRGSSWSTTCMSSRHQRPARSIKPRPELFLRLRVDTSGLARALRGLDMASVHEYIQPYG